MTQDPSLHDEQLEAEIRLVGDLVLAASQCEGHLSDEAIDAVLGLDEGDDPGAGEEPAAGEEPGAGDHAGSNHGAGSDGSPPAGGSSP